MPSDLITAALRTASDTRAIEFGRGIVTATGRLFADVFPGRSALVVADENTWAVAGPAVVASLEAAGVTVLEPSVFPGIPTLYADYANVVPLRDHLAATDAVICAIGSGTLNDICKLASGELGRGYLVVGTAASQDGYAAFGASITRAGFKITRTCPAPTAIVADLDIMAAAPVRLTATGYGDIIEKVPAGADWVIADELGIEPIDADVWNLVQPPLRGAISDPAGLAAREVGAIGRLAEGLIMSGLAMQAHQSSRPASGAGHNFSHQWEMEGHGLDWEPPLSHGMKVGLGTVAICALYDVVRSYDLSDIDPDERAAAWLSPAEDVARVRALHTNPVIADAAVAQSRLKYVRGDQAADRVRDIQAAWPRILDRIAPLLMTADEVRAQLKAVGGVYEPTQIGISPERMRQTYLQAQTIRSRYTLLDLLHEVGLLHGAVSQVSSGF